MTEPLVLSAVLQLNGSETLPESEVPSSSSPDGRDLIHDKYGVTLELDSTTTPAVLRIIAEEIVLGASPHVIDLQAGIGSAEQVWDLTGLKLAAWQIEADAGNVAAITVDPTVTDGYELFGAGNDRELLAGELDDGLIRTTNNKPAVAAADRYIEISGTLGDSFRYLMYFG